MSCQSQLTTPVVVSVVPKTDCIVLPLRATWQAPVASLDTPANLSSLILKEATPCVQDAGGKQLLCVGREATSFLLSLLGLFCLTQGERTEDSRSSVRSPFLGGLELEAWWGNLMFSLLGPTVGSSV